MIDPDPPPTSLRALHGFLDSKQQIGTAAANVAASVAFDPGDGDFFGA